jgi:RsiW-degrading membrane proteinase PrsW (M82 family)
MLTLISVLLFVATSALLVWFFVKNDRGPKEPLGALVAAAGFGLVAVALAAWAELLFLPDPTSNTHTTLTLFFISLMVGSFEELAKFTPLALFIRNKSYFNEHTDGVIYFGIAGLTFGFVENLLYLFFNNEGGMVGIFRLIILFFFHAAATGIVGYYFAKAKIQHRSLLKPILALATLTVVHGIYDFLFFYASSSAQRGYASFSENTLALIALATVSGLVISALLNTFLFLYYRRAKQWDASIGLANDPSLPVMLLPSAATASSTTTTWTGPPAVPSPASPDPLPPVPPGS